MLSAACTPHLQPVFDVSTPEIKLTVVIERRSHPFPFRTRQLSSASPMILRGQLRGKVGRRRDKIYERPSGKLEGLFLFRLRNDTRHVFFAHASGTCIALCAFDVPNRTISASNAVPSPPPRTALRDR